MASYYFWAGRSPNPEPAAYPTTEAYFDALRFAGDGVVPGDRWSYISDSAAFDKFYDEGKVLGYGLSVNGLEARLPLRIRYVEPESPAAAQGLERGDTILAINGKSDAELLASGDFGALGPNREGDAVSISIGGPSGSREVTLLASTYLLTPVSAARVLTLAGGRKAGYLVLKEFISQAEAPLAKAFEAFAADGVSDIILDLRYNGGGSVATSNVLASLIAGASHNGQTFVRLDYNSQQPSLNAIYSLGASTPGFERVVILTGARTCSASELVINGLKPYLPVVTIGARTCGKPFGFRPVTSCGQTFSAVNFESLNALGEGHYYDGIGASCAATDEFTRPLGDLQESLTLAAADYLQTGQCATAATAKQFPAGPSIPSGARRSMPEPGERRGMWVK